VARDEELWIVEVNPRYSASVEVLERIANVPFVKLHVTACIDNALPPEPTIARRHFAGKAIVYARQPCTITPAMDELIDQEDREAQWPTLADVPYVGQTFDIGQPVMTVLAAGRSFAEVERTLHDRLAACEHLLLAGTRIGPG
jgi:predicted ATP-grasp superfamily ATP-dependent carboligase